MHTQAPLSGTSVKLLIAVFASTACLWFAAKVATLQADIRLWVCTLKLYTNRNCAANGMRIIDIVVFN